jgi:hypothetical protein
VDIGNRPVGSEGLKRAQEMLLSKINEVQLTAKGDQGMNIAVQVQNVSGAYYLADNIAFLFQYDNVQNIVVRVSRNDQADNVAVLISAHVDSVFTAPGN